MPLVLALTAGAASAGLSEVMAEANLEKRSEKAVHHAAQVLKSARKAYDAGEIDKTQSDLSEVGEAVELAWKSLEETGKDPHKKSKYFKRAEIGTRRLLRDLDAFAREMNVADRPMVEPIRKRVAKIHDDLLLGIMGGKR